MRMRLFSSLRIKKGHEYLKKYEHPVFDKRLQRCFFLSEIFLETRTRFDKIIKACPL